MNRRDFLQASSAVASLGLLGGCRPDMTRSGRAGVAPSLPFYDAVPPLAPIRAHEDRLFKITVCTRPFRAAGPRIEAERVGDKLIVHNYGHGGSGWSLSWGSAAVATELALAGSDPSTQDVAVLGCGALGLTAALTLQRAGCRSVNLYARERPAEARSFRATGSWTPDSRVALTASASPAFAAQWEQMARTSWRAYQAYLGLAGNPVEFTDRYFLSDLTPEQSEQKYRDDDPIGFAYLRPRIQDLAPHSLDLPPGTHPCPTRFARRNSQLMFNITAYSRALLEEFHLNGGKLIASEFHSPAELARLPQRTVLNCTGFGARALFGDTSVTPVRGQIAWLIPQPEVNYGLVFDNLNILGRRDGIVVQLSEQGEATGWNDATETPDRREADAGVQMIQRLYARMSAHAGAVMKRSG